MTILSRIIIIVLALLIVYIGWRAIDPTPETFQKYPDQDPQTSQEALLDLLNPEDGI